MGGDGAIEEGIGPAVGAVYVLISEYEFARFNVLLQAAGSARANDPLDAQSFEGPHVGPVVDFVGGQGVIPAMARHKGHSLTADGTNGNGGAGRTVRGFHLDFNGVVDEVVEAGTAEYADFRLMFQFIGEGEGRHC